MMYVAMNEDRISNPVILEIDPEVIYDKDTMFADRNATRNGLTREATLTVSRKFTFRR